MSDMYIIVRRQIDDDTQVFRWSVPDGEMVYDSLEQADYFLEEMIKHRPYLDDEFNELHIVRLDFGWNSQ
jgi:hypothetical protein